MRLLVPSNPWSSDRVIRCVTSFARSLATLARTGVLGSPGFPGSPVMRVSLLPRILVAPCSVNHTGGELTPARRD